MRKIDDSEKGNWEVGSTVVGPEERKRSRRSQLPVDTVRCLQIKVSIYMPRVYRPCLLEQFANGNSFLSRSYYIGDYF